MELDMTRGRPAGLIVRFVIPIIIGNIFQQLYSMADTIIVGRFVGVEALAAVGIAYRTLMKKMIQSKAAFCGESAHAQTEARQQTRTEHNPV